MKDKKPKSEEDMKRDINKGMKEIIVDALTLPKAKLSPTSNPNIFWDKGTGELYFLEERNPVRFGMGFSDPHLIKLNDKRE